MDPQKNTIFPSTDELNATALNITLTTDDDDDDRPVYISGNFNEWRTQDADFEMHKTGKGKYSFQFSALFRYPDALLYKFTKGDWSAVEIDRFGNRTENRVCRQQSGTRAEHVERWRKNWLPFKPDFLPQIHLISDEFEMPQLNRKRKIWALLPYDYEHSDESYPVLYLHDAQNLFNENAPFGNWQIDKKLAVMSEYQIGKIIIIAVEHGEKERIKEYNVGKTVLGAGRGQKYIRFITETLKPFVDSKFRTKASREFTGIGGSSMGGLVSIFSGLMYPDVYGKLMIFSPSLWVVSKMNFAEIDFHNRADTKLYLYAGGDESATMIEHVRKFKKEMIRSGFSDKMKIKVSINKNGTHSETYWSDEFPKAIEWLFFNTKDN